MFHAAFQVHCPIRDSSVEEVRICLSDETIERALRALDQGQMDLRIGVKIAAHGEGAELMLEWCTAMAGFQVRYEGRSAGFVPFDEFRGALGKPFSAQDVPVQVCLRGDVDVWRRGVLSLERGEVMVYTATRGLGFLGVGAFANRGGGCSDFFILSGGDPAMTALRIPSREMVGISRAEGNKVAADRLACLDGVLPPIERIA